MSTAEFYTLFSGMTTSLNAFAYNLTRNNEEAKDLYQETAIRAISNKDKFKPGTNLKAWLFTIMKNIFINNYRKKTKRNTVIDTTENSYYLNSGQTVENQAAGNIIMSELEGIIGEIDDTLSEPFMMYHEGYKYQEISDMLTLPLGTVKSRIFFARKAIRELIESRYGNQWTIREKLYTAS